MKIIYFLFVNNWIFKCYLCLLLLFNILMFYIFAFENIYTNKKTIQNNIYGKDNSTDIDANTDIVIRYIFMFKKIIKIAKNPIIFEYQLKQIEKIDKNSNKYNQYRKDLEKIKNNKKSLKIQQYYQNIKKILLSSNNKNKVDETIIKFFCINF